MINIGLVKNLKIFQNDHKFSWNISFFWLILRIFEETKAILKNVLISQKPETFLKINEFQENLIKILRIFEIIHEFVKEILGSWKIRTFLKIALVSPNILRINHEIEIFNENFRFFLKYFQILLTKFFFVDKFSFLLTNMHFLEKYAFC